MQYMNENRMILQIISRYNENQEDYHRNMRYMLPIMNNIISSRQSNSYTFELGVSDAANVLLSMLDPSGTRLTSGISPQDISGRTTVFNFDEESPPLVCPITLEQVQVGEPVMRITRCGHRFREEALRRWFANHERCPVCRGNI
jgi:hypothetical protein